MASKSNTSPSARRRAAAPQDRGQIRRQKLREAALACLEDTPLDALTLVTVAARAGIPKASAYHFYASIHDLYAEMVAQFGERLGEAMILPPDSAFADWRALVEQVLLGGVDLLNESTVGRKLVLSPEVPPRIKLGDRRNDLLLGVILREQVARHFRLPERPDLDLRFYYAIEIVDFLCGLSVAEHGFVTPEMRTESVRAGCAYLGLHLPADMPPAAL